MAGVAVEARDLSKQFILRHNRGASIKTRLLGVLHERQRERLEPFWALRDISLSIGRGEQVGLVGRNGSGKSTLMKLVAGIHRPTSGHLLIARDATIGTMIELGVGFHPDLTGTENVFLNAAIHGRSRAEIEAIYPAIVEYSGLDRFMDVALKNYSSGMHMRLGFAVAANLNPDILLLDEVFAVGDEDFQNKCMKTMAQFAAGGRTIVFVSHSVAAVRSMCRRVCVLDAGRLLFDGHVERGLAAYQKLLQGSLGATPSDGQPAIVEQPAEDVTDLARRLLGEWTFEWLKREGLQPHHRVVEIGIQPVIGSPCPILDYVGASNYAYWQAGRPAPAALTSANYVVAGSVFLHFPLNVIARMIATAQRDLPAGARFYATFFEAPGMQTFVPTPWPGGFVTSADSVPYQYSLDLLTGIAEAFGATVHRVEGVTHPNGESGLVIVK